jgi:hypothetical protein
MKWFGILLSLALLAPGALAEDILRAPIDSGDANAFAPEMTDHAAAADYGRADGGEGGSLTSDRAFPGFIGFVSNPTRAFDPRALTQLWPLFISSWTDQFGPISSGDIQGYGAGLSIALSDRLCAGLSNGGYMVAHLNREREGWANLGGFVQYTVIRDVPDQFLLTAGIIWEAPSGSKDIFQGTGPVYLAPYLTAGKEFGCYHVLANVGYNFAAGSGRSITDSVYANLHLDRRLFGWLYPLVEFSGTWNTTKVDLNLAERPGFIEFGRFDNTSSMVTVAPGVNTVLVQNHLELGAIYETPIWSQHNFNFNQVLVKVILRY